MKKRLFIAFLLSLLFLVSPGIPVHAQTIPNPDGFPTITRKWANRNLLEPGDMCLYWQYRIPYATPPTTYDVAEAFTWKLYDASETFLLGYNSSYPYNQYGWNYGVASMYFYAASNPGWGAAYKIHLVSNPGIFAAPLDYEFDFLTSDYSTANSAQTYQRAELREKIIRIAQDLEIRWDKALLDEADVGTILSLKGELYFRAAVPLLDSMCPNLFYFQVSDPDYSDRAWSQAYSTSLVSQWDGTAIGEGIDAAGELFSVDTMVIGSVVVIVLCIIVLWFSTRKAMSINSGLADCYPVILTASLMGIFPFAIAGFIDFLGWSYLGYILIFRR